MPSPRRIANSPATREDLRKEWGRLKTDQRRVATRDKAVGEAAAELDQKRDQYRQQLEMAANLTADEAKELLLENLAVEVKGSWAAMIRAERARAREESDREARKIIAQAIQRCAVEEAEHFSTSTVALPNEGLKSRIIGKEGRNVRAFENATGVKVVVDDTPDTVLGFLFRPDKKRGRRALHGAAGKGRGVHAQQDR